MPDQYRCQACGEPMGMPGMWGSTRDLHTPAVCEDCHVKGARTTTPCPQCERLRTRLESAEQERDRLREAFAETSRLDVSAMEVSAERLKQNETLRARLENAEQERAKLQEFKEFCHLYLDAYGVPHHPPGTHGAEGCRIGDRLDWILAHRDRLESTYSLLRELAAEIRPILDMNTRDLGGILCGAGGGHRQWLMEKAISHVLLLLRRAEAEAGEEKPNG